MNPTACLVVFCGCLAAVAAAVSSAELGALNDLYVSAGGATWAWRPPIFNQGVEWDFTSTNSQDPDPCAEDWQGISCGGLINSYITSLRLPVYNLTGTIPESICNLTRLENLELSVNSLHGPIPSRIGDLSDLTKLDLNNNLLTSSVPTGVGNLTALKTLLLYYNSITGSIPETIGNLHLLTMLEMDSNSLTGGIPSSIGLMSSLERIYLYDNWLSKSIPSEIGLLSNLVDFVAHTNAMTGQLPSSLAKCSLLELLILNANKFTGTIPDEIGNLTMLDNLYLYQSYFTGTIPSSFSKLEKLTILGVSFNLLSGTIPHAVGSMSNLQVFDVSFNVLTGTVPPMKNFTDLQYFLIQVNHITGTIPNELAELTTLIVIDMIENELTGTLPVGLDEQMVNLQFLLYSENHLTGTLPSSYLCLPAVLQMEIQMNYLSGALSTCNDTFRLSASSLATLDLSVNYFQGTIPSEFTHLLQLHYLILSDNQIEGSLDNLYNFSRQSVMSVIDISDNLFSGSIPENFFLGQLEVFSASTNCLRGALPVSLCNASTLVTLGADGAGAGTKCRSNNKFQFSTRATFPNGLMTCLFNLPMLSTLHLSGNGITGTLPPFGPNMTIKDLVLSYNELTGTIPIEYQARGFQTFDLSHNALTGSLGTSVFSMPVNGSLKLMGNLLSGNLPTSIKHTQDISVLSGNIFSCNFNRESLPIHDEYRISYSCGSALANGALIFWACFICLAVAVGLKVRWMYTTAAAAECDKDNTTTSHDKNASDTVCSVVVESVGRWKLWYSLFSEEQHSACSYLLVYLKDLEHMCISFVCYLTFILLPAFSTLTYYYHTYTFQYAWTVSAVLNAGFVPGIILVIIWWCMVGAYSLYYVAWWHKAQGKDKCFTQPFDKNKGTNENLLSKRTPSSSLSLLSPSPLPSISLSTSSPSPMQPAAPSTSRSSLTIETDKGERMPTYSKNHIKLIRVSTYSLALFVNVIVVGGLNAAYVYFYFNYDSLNYTSLRVTQVAFAAFKVLWSATVVPAILFRLRNRIKKIGYKADIDVEKDMHGIEYQTFLVLLNNIAIPMVAAALFSSHCFYDAVVNAPAVDVNYGFMTCGTYVLEGGILSCYQIYMKKKFTTFNPSFSYRYQCSSDLVMEYVPIFLFMFAIVAIVVPTLQLVASVAHPNNSTTRQSQFKSARKAPVLWQYLFRFCNFFSSKTVKTLYHIHHMQSQEKQFQSNSSDDVMSAPTTIFNSDFFCVTIMQHCAVILTFGVYYPLLGICGCIAVLVNVQMTRLDLGRVLQELQEERIEAEEGLAKGNGGERSSRSSLSPALVDRYLQILRVDCHKIHNFRHSALWLIVAYATVFHILFITDTLGPETPWSGLVLTMASICFAPILARVAIGCYTSRE